MMKLIVGISLVWSVAFSLPSEPQWSETKRRLQEKTWYTRVANYIAATSNGKRSFFDWCDDDGGLEGTFVPTYSPTFAPNPSPTNPSPTNPSPTNPSPTNPTPTNPAPTNPSNPSPFTISLTLSGVTSEFEFQNAATTWSRVITDELPDITATLPGTSFCGAWPASVDDLHICGQYAPIDGVGGVLGAAGPRHYRPGSFIPITGEMKFDSSDVTRPGFNLLGVILHEMGHVLGLGSMWRLKGLTTSASPPCPYKTDSAASREYQRLSGCTGRAIPLEQSFSGSGSNCGHWEETCFDREIMTPAADSTLPVTRLTIAGLEDLGYKVDYGIAELFASSELNVQCQCNRRLRADSDSWLLNGDPDESSPMYRRLSEEGMQIAVNYGHELLAEHRASNNLLPGDGDYPDIGTEVIFVLYEEADGGIHSIMVTDES